MGRGYLPTVLSSRFQEYRVRAPIARYEPKEKAVTSGGI